eukprot:7777314-Pyramimonas_sp.AAC.1
MEGRMPEHTCTTECDKIATRAMRRGLGKRGLHGHAEDEFRRWSARELWAHWRMLPTSDELRLRRVRWYQSWAKCPSRHRQVRACVSGPL